MQKWHLGFTSGRNTETRERVVKYWLIIEDTPYHVLFVRSLNSLLSRIMWKTFKSVWWEDKVYCKWEVWAYHRLNELERFQITKERYDELVAVVYPKKNK